jgi:Zn-dependent protease
MLLSYLDLLFYDSKAFFLVFPAIASIVAIALLVVITLHECSHSLLAYLLGDSTSKRLGRLSLNPFRHIEPTGLILFFLIGFGWGKPVPVNQHALLGGRKGMAVVSAAGPISNILTAVIFAIPMKLGLIAWPAILFPSRFSGFGAELILSHIVATIVLFSIVLGVFNLLPLAPLDGSGVALGLLPRSLANTLERLQKYGQTVLIVAIMADIVFGIGIISGLISPVINYLSIVIVGEVLMG